MSTYEQLPSRAYPALAFPGRMLAHGAAGTGLGLSFPSSEQRPRRAYALGSHPLHHLARLTGGGSGLGLTYPNGEQICKRGYPLGALPLHHLARLGKGGVEPSIFTGGGGDAKEMHWMERHRNDFRRRNAKDESDILEFLAIISSNYQ